MMNRLLLFLFFINLSFITLGQGDPLEITLTDNYIFQGHFPKENPNIAFNGNALNHHRIYIDTTDKMTIAEIRILDKQLNWQNPFEVSCEAGKVYWLKATFNGSPHFSGQPLLHIAPELGRDEFSFDYMDAYIFKKDGTQLHQKTGDRIPLRKRPIDFWASFIKLELQATDTLDLWVRMEGTDVQLLMHPIGLFHIDELSLFPYQVNYAWKNGIFYGIVGIQFFFFLLLFFMEKDKIHLYFCIYILGYMLGVAFTRENFTQYMPIPAIDDDRIIWVNVGVFLVVLGLLKFTEAYFSYPKNSVFSKWVIPLLIFFGAINTLFFATNPSIRIPALRGILFLMLALCIILLAFNTKKKQPKLVRTYLLAFLPIIIIFSVFSFFRIFFHTYFDQRAWLMTLFTDLFKVGGIWKLTFLSINIGIRTNRLKAEKAKVLQKNLEDQKRINEAISRFVPNEFLQALDKMDLTQVQLGNHTQKEVTVFFSNLQAYATLSAQMSPERNFRLINACNVVLGPVVQHHHGFVNQYMGEGIMAIFPQSPRNALQAAIQMQHLLRDFNKSRIKKGQTPIKAGIGMHTGPLIMGITGDSNRLDATTISDSVNAAARIESLTERFGASILLSESCLEKLPTDHPFNLRYLGKVKVKGKQQLLKVYECFDGETTEAIATKLATSLQFEQGINYYENQDYQKAFKTFELVLKTNPLDETAKFFLKKIQEKSGNTNAMSNLNGQKNND